MKHDKHAALAEELMAEYVRLRRKERTAPEVLARMLAEAQVHATLSITVELEAARVARPARTSSGELLPDARHWTTGAEADVDELKAEVAKGIGVVGGHTAAFAALEKLGGMARGGRLAVGGYSRKQVDLGHEEEILFGAPRGEEDLRGTTPWRPEYAVLDGPVVIGEDEAGQIARAAPGFERDIVIAAVARVLRAWDALSLDPLRLPEVPQWRELSDAIEALRDLLPFPFDPEAS